MKLWQILALAAISALLTSYAVADEEESAAAETVTIDAAERQQQLEQAVEKIRAAENAAEAASFYARGNTIDKLHAPLHRAYMHRMLELGLPQLAAHPARTLTVLRPEDEPLAWAVAGHYYARRNHWNDALEATMRAAEELPNTEAVLHNAGQLTAWYERSHNQPRASDRTKRAMAKMLSENLPKGNAFASAYKDILTAYDAHARAVEVAQEIIVEIGEEIAEYEQALSANRQEIAAVEVEINHNQRVLDDLERELRRLKRLRDRALRRQQESTDATVVIYRDNDPYGIEITELRREIREVNRHLGELYAIRIVLHRARNDLLAQLRGKRDELAEKRRELDFDMELRLRRHFRWDSPEPDGSVATERDYTPQTTTVPAAEVADVQRIAESRLRLAELYLRNNMAEKAAETLRDIVRDYPDTEAADQSKALLESIAVTDAD